MIIANSLNYSKHVSWRTKASSYNLLTLDILNRNYPNVLNICFFCDNTQESNEHLWTCPQTNTLLIPWTNNPPSTLQDAPDLHCLLINMVPSSKVEPFKQAKINKKLSKTILLKFLYDLHHDIYESLWKIRAVKWKAWK
ncbi:hypothetical protein RhiirA5_417186 [Rhizophagus irregularis]|uniref:Reverse transcriptase zinc-binding domain-containing protein n=1 Tax=Rhizophagus irregularis TaxID=588596 RepID=A0A2N0PN60_9GLOM|nr:hypothetical protein RhiirA5_417186 [Rhizophagus irregularis]GBC44856.2 ribonuclease H-like domain-containing protein [Rhizophagus irregularis DAOM 181602=DAOM 197198]